MFRVLALSKIFINGEFYIRFLCIKSNINSKKAFDMINSVPLICYNVNDIISLFENNKNDLFFYDYNLGKFDIFMSLPLIRAVNSIDIKVLSSQETFIKLINRYDPTLLSHEEAIINQYLSYKGGWLFYNNTPICIWKPSFKDNNISKHIGVNDNCIIYNNERCVYILTNDNLRHRQARLGELFTVNLNSLECTRFVSKIDKNNMYKEKKQYFNRQIRDWVSYQETEPVYVLGCKK